MDQQNNGHTGPRSTKGKKTVAKNAQKSAIFSPGYLKSEDVAQKEAQFAKLCKQWGANDASRQLIVRTIEQASLSLERMMRAEKCMIEGAMHSLDIAMRFALKANISGVKAMHLPAWYFSEDDGGQKENALWFNRVWTEAGLLQHHFSDRDVPHISERYSHLYEYVMKDNVQNKSFIVRLGERYKQSTVILNLSALMNQLREDYEFHLIWAIAPERHQRIIDEIRAGQMIAVMDLEKTTRYATGFQNRILKGFQALALLAQYDAHPLGKAQALPLQAKPSPHDPQPE